MTLSNEFFWTGKADFLLDTGSDLNLIREETFNNKILINNKNNFNLISIGKGLTKTLDAVEIPVKGELTKFQVIPAKFQIRHKIMNTR